MWYAVFCLVVLQVAARSAGRSAALVRTLLLLAVLAYPVQALVALTRGAYFQTRGGWVQIAGMILVLWALLRSRRKPAAPAVAPVRTKRRWRQVLHTAAPPESTASGAGVADMLPGGGAPACGTPDAAGAETGRRGSA